MMKDRISSHFLSLIEFGGTEWKEYFHSHIIPVLVICDETVQTSISHTRNDGGWTRLSLTLVRNFSS